MRGENPKPKPLVPKDWGGAAPCPLPKVYILTSHGGSRLVTIGQFLPQDWALVRIVPQWQDEEAVLLKFERVA